MSSAEARKKPRIRKTAPTIRERVEAAQVKTQQEKPRRVSKAFTKAASPLKKVRVPAHRIPKPVRTTGRYAKKGLGFLVPRYFINSWREVRMVTWPTRKETWRLTAAVFIFAAIFGALVSGVDKVLDIIFKHFVLK